MEPVRRSGLCDWFPGYMGWHGPMDAWFSRCPELQRSILQRKLSDAGRQIPGVEDRVLAKYRPDSTTNEKNFQPGITLRAAVGHILAGGDISKFPKVFGGSLVRIGNVGRLAEHDRTGTAMGGMYYSTPWRQQRAMHPCQAQVVCRRSPIYAGADEDYERIKQSSNKL